MGRHYELGYQECAVETIRFLEGQGFLRTGNLCVKLDTHLKRIYKRFFEGNLLQRLIFENHASNVLAFLIHYSTVDAVANFGMPSSDSANIFLCF